MNIARRLRTVVAAVAAALSLGLVSTGSASAAYENTTPGFDILTITPTDTKAGGHPNVAVHYKYRYDDMFQCQSNCLFPRYQRIDWPEGFVGNPHVTPKCTLTEFSTQKCPSDSQIGVFVLIEVWPTPIMVPLYNLQTRPDQAGLAGFIAPLFGIPFQLELTSRTDSDYGLHAETSPIFRLPLPNQELYLWGVPQADEHDSERFVTPIEGSGFCEKGIKGGCPPGEEFNSPTRVPATTPAGPLLQNPTVCGIPLTARSEIEYHGGAIASQEVAWPATTGCSQASFTPSITAKMTTTGAETASGLDAILRVPQTQSPDTPAPSELKTSRLTMPEGVSFNPNAADGKVACPEFLSAIGTLLAANCPEFSKVGTLMLDVAALPAPIPGALYLAEPKPGEPYRILLTASGFATHVKLLGRVEPDPQTGQVTVIFENLPQSPLQEFDLHIFGSERGLLTSPSHCGTYEMKGEFVPWNSALETRTSINTITISSGPNGGPCPSTPRRLNPDFKVGVANSTAGRHAPFSLALTRADGEQGLTGLTVTTAPGFSASLKGVPYCPESAITTLNDSSYSGVSEQQSPSCPVASQVGTATVGVGTGSHPLYVDGKAYLAGPYEGAPLSLVVVVPAVSGPYDLGNVAVRAAINVNPVTAQITTVSDPLPQILEGIPLRVRSVLINLDRPGFALNPTNCEPLSVRATVLGDEGGTANLSSHYQVANCARLPFAPKLTLKLTGSTKQAGNPALTATLTAKPGEANISRAQVTLPPTELVDNAHIRNICTRVQFNEGKTPGEKCPPGSILGFAKADTPLLEKPLEGPIYLRSTGRAGLPDIVAALDGQIEIVLAGRIDSVRRSLRATFENVPDAPVTKVVLSFYGGERGLIENSPRLCAHAQHFTAAMTGQNGMTTNRRPVLGTPCGKKHKRKARAHHNRRAHR